MAWDKLTADFQEMDRLVAAGKPLPPNDFITVLSSADRKVLTKQHTSAGTISHDKGLQFTSTRRPIYSLEDLAAALNVPPRSCVIHGKIREGIDPQTPHRRLCHPKPDGTPPSYEHAAHAFAVVDIDEHTENPDGSLKALLIPEGHAWLDDPDASVRRVIAEWLPPELHSVDVAWRLTGSAGRKPGIHLRLAFMLDRPVTMGELKAWFADAPSVDHAIYNPVQPIYGDPVFDGVPDPIAQRGLARSGVIRGSKKRALVPADLGDRVKEQKDYESGWQTGSPISLSELNKMFAALPPPTEYKVIRDIAAATAAANVPDDPDMSERCEIFSDWALGGSVNDNDGQDFRRVFHSLAKPGGITIGTLIRYAKNGYVLPNLVS
jgi:hypothetical protein